VVCLGRSEVTLQGADRGARRSVPETAEQHRAAAFEEALERLSDVVAGAAARELQWPARLRAGVVALLGFLDEEPLRGRLLLSEAPTTGAGQCGRCVQDVLGGLLDERRAERIANAPAEPAPELVRELILGGVFSVIRERLLDPRRTPLVTLAPSLTSFILGSANPQPAGEQLEERATRAEPLPIRATYRTACVLRAIDAAPRSSNREVAQAAELADEGQASKLLGRLERRGLIENVGLGAACGEPNAWLLTAEGRRVVKAIGHGFVVGPALGRGRRVRGAA
jgi:hypothetical protein